MGIHIFTIKRFEFVEELRKRHLLLQVPFSIILLFPAKQAIDIDSDIGLCYNSVGILNVV